MTIHDPASDLHLRAARWNHSLEDASLGSISRFASSLAATEADAWDNEQLDVATRAYEERRFLLGDRVIHWAVPWLLASGDDDNSAFLLALADEMRVAPVLPGREGLVVPGEDSYGPDSQTGSIWSGWVDGLDIAAPSDIESFWARLATQHPGSGQLWLDLARRADRNISRRKM